jgi:type IV secretory pathway TrbD component
MVTKGKKMKNQVKAALDSYLRNLLGVGLALVTTTMASAGVSSPLDFGVAEWLAVANGLWAAAVPTLIRWANKKDPAFGLVAQVVASSVSKKISEETAKTTTKPSAGTGKVASGDSKKTAAKKTAAKKPATKK